MELDILAFGAHPDDTELGCAGVLSKHAQMGHKVGVVDLTMGEAGTRGTAEIRMQEAAAAADIIGLVVRENLKWPDAYFEDNASSRNDIIRVIRKYRPKIILAPAVEDRHPDHARAAKIISEAAFYSGLRKISTDDEGTPQDVWRANQLYHYIQSNFIQPDFVVDVTEQWDTKMNAIKAFKSQFFDPDSSEPVSPIATESFLEFIKSRAVDLGRPAYFDYAEGFTANRTLGVNSLTDLK